MLGVKYFSHGGNLNIFLILYYSCSYTIEVFVATYLRYIEISITYILIIWIICCLEFTFACAIYDTISIETKKRLFTTACKICSRLVSCNALLQHTICKTLIHYSRSELNHLIISQLIKCILVHMKLQIHKLEHWCAALMISKAWVKKLYSSNVYRWLSSNFF